MFAQAITIAVSMLAGHGFQRGRPASVFSYDAVQAASHSVQEKRPPTGSKIVGVNGERPGKKPDAAPSFVNISGNFGGVFYVSGVGNAVSQSQTSLVNITTNRSLTFSASSFKPLMLNESSEGSIGTVSYSMAIYQGNSTHRGALVAGPVAGTDAAFNGQTIGLNVVQGPANENFVLVLTRTLTITASATGATTLVGTGFIGVTLN